LLAGSDQDQDRVRLAYNFPEAHLLITFCSALIPSYAQYQASLPAMWGNQIPTSHGVQQLANAFVVEWNWAVDQMLRHWERPPVGGH